MLLKNLDTSHGLVNGARGVVIGFEKSEKRSNLYSYLPLVRFEVKIADRVDIISQTLTEEKWEIGNQSTGITTRYQIPLMIAYAISIHKAQGMTIPQLEVRTDAVNGISRLVSYRCLHDDIQVSSFCNSILVYLGFIFGDVRIWTGVRGAVQSNRLGDSFAENV